MRPLSLQTGDSPEIGKVLVITGTASAKDIADEMAGVELPAHTAAYTSINRTETSSATTPQLLSSLS